jgi:hypothetical protein
MAKATIRTSSESPTEQVTKAANAIEHYTDARGRRIGVVKPSALARYRILKMLGSENAGNQHVLGYAMLAACVRELDGQQVMAPNSEREIEVLIDRLGDEGLAAVGQCMAEKFGFGSPDKEGDEETLRNL